MSKMSKLDVFYHNRYVGTLALTKDFSENDIVAIEII